MKILVSGGAGFVGQNLARRLVSEGHDVTITASTTDHVDFDGEVFYSGICGLDFSQIRRRKFDVLFHQAANNDTLFVDYVEMKRANVKGSMRIFDAVRKGGCKNIIYASSTAVYGSQPAPYLEDVTLVEPLNAYALSKAVLERKAFKFSKDYGVRIVGLRYCNVYGPGEEHKGRRMSMVGQMIRVMMSGKKVSLFKDGSQRRDWVYVEDVVEANMKAMISDSPSDVFNIGSGASIRFDALAKLIAEKFRPMPIVLEDHVVWIEHPFPDKYQSYTECNIEKARKNLSYEPRFDVKSGVMNYLSSFSEPCGPYAVSTQRNHGR